MTGHGPQSRHTECAYYVAGTLRVPSAECEKRHIADSGNQHRFATRPQ
jgi:hypothetical protein